MSWAEVIRKLKAAGFIEVWSGKGSHLLLKRPPSGKEVWVAVHTKKEQDIACFTDDLVCAIADRRRAFLPPTFAHACQRTRELS